MGLQLSGSQGCAVGRAQDAGDHRGSKGNDPHGKAAHQKGGNAESTHPEKVADLRHIGTWLNLVKLILNRFIFLTFFFFFFCRKK